MKTIMALLLIAECTHASDGPSAARPDMTRESESAFFDDAFPIPELRDYEETPRSTPFTARPGDHPLPKTLPGSPRRSALTDDLTPRRAQEENHQKKLTQPPVLK